MNGTRLKRAIVSGSRCVWLVAVFAAVFPASSAPIHAGDIKLYADDPGPDEADSEEPSPRRLETKDYTPRRSRSSHDDGFGMIGRTGYWAIGNFGITDPMGHLEAMPYYISDEHFFFSDIRGFVTNYGRAGGNFGLGYRFLDSSREGWYGGSVWYDADDSSSNLFQQVGVSGEAVFRWFELRSNGYLPVGNRNGTFSNQITNVHFAGNQLLYNQLSQSGYSLAGFDLEAGAPLPLPFLRASDQVRVFAGLYYFPGNTQANVTGFKARAEAVINNTVNTQVSFTTDNVFGSQVAVGVQLYMPWGANHPSSNYRKDTPSPFRFVERNYNVILEQTQTAGANLVAVNPLTGSNYFVRHVSGTGTSGGDGSIDHPFATIAQALAAGGSDFVFVHSDTSITSGVTLNPGDRVLGDGMAHAINILGFGNTAMPSLATVGNRPVINVASGPAVTLANNSELSGFTFQNINGNAIEGSNVSGVSLHDLTFQNVSGDAIHLTSLGGTSTLQNLTFNQVGSAVSINGGSPELTMNGLTINDTTGDSVVLSGLTNSTVTIRGLDIEGSQGSGLVLNNLAGTVTVVAPTVNDTTIDGIRVQGGTADVTFNGVTTIDSDQGRGFVLSGTGGTIQVDNLNVTGAGTGAAVAIDHTTDDITFSYLTLNRTAGPGLLADTASSLTITDGTITTVGGAAVDIQNSANAIALTSVNVNGGAYGIRLNNTTGTFQVKGNGVLDSGGTIQNVTTGVILNHAGSIELDWVRLTATQTGVQSSGNDYLALFRLDAVGNTGYAVDSLDDRALFIGSSTFAGNGALGGGTIRMQSDQFDNYQVTIADNTITDANGKAIQILNSAGSAGSSMTLAFRNNTIEASRDSQTAVQVQWNGPVGFEFSGNTLTLDGVNMIGVDLASQSNTSNLSATFTRNTLHMVGGQAIAYRVAASATSAVEMSNSGFEFVGNNSTGFSFTGVGAAQLYLVNNNLLSTTGTGSTGFLMNNVAAGSNVRIDSNSMNFDNGSAVIDRGFVFTTLTSPVALQGTYDNVLNSVTQPLVIPSGQTTGGFFINSSWQQP